jgi:hypothetical protein
LYIPCVHEESYTFNDISINYQREREREGERERERERIVETIFPFKFMRKTIEEDFYLDHQREWLISAHKDPTFNKLWTNQILYFLQFRHVEEINFEEITNNTWARKSISNEKAKFS